MWWNPYLSVPANKRNLIGALSVVTVLALWSFLSGFEVVSPVKLPPPWATAQALIRLMWDVDRGESMLLEAILWSTGRVAVAGILVVFVGVPIGVLMGASPRINAALSPLVDPLRSAPAAAFLPIVIMWLGIEEGSKIAFLFLGSIFYLIPMTRDAIKAVPPSYWISAYDLGATPFEAVMKAAVPMAKPRIADAINVSVSIMWTYITVAEYMNAKRGLGQIIQHGRQSSSMATVLAGVLVIIAVALVTYWVMSAIKKKLYPWEVEG
jgi:ABC-type nitrate/sulfonate/bicarbonate transport system permease component